MTLIQICALFLALIAAIGWLNARFLRLSPSIAMVCAGVIGAAVLLAAQIVIGPFWGFNDVRSVVRTLDFGQTVMGYMLGFLLFASGLQADLGAIRQSRLAIWTLATVGILVSTALVGGGLWLISAALGLRLPLAWALTFGALISPTDPIAVLAAMRSGAVSARLGAVLQGEGLFNDGVGFVAFSEAAAFAASGALPHPLIAAGTILLEAGGGLALGFVAAYAVAFLLKGVDDHAVQVAATLALAVGVYVLAGLAHMSGPVAAATAGLVIGSSGMRAAMSGEAWGHIEGFWDLIDQILNAALFLLLGLQVFVLPFHVDEIGLWVAAIVLSAGARLVVVLPWGAFFHVRHEERGASFLLTWGGLRGAISLALALSLPEGRFKDTLLAMTFVAVIFSVVVQGLTFGPFAERLRRAAA